MASRSVIADRWFPISWSGDGRWLGRRGSLHQQPPSAGPTTARAICSSAGPRTVWLSSPARRILDRLERSGPWVFPRPRGNGPRRDFWLHGLWDRRRGRANISRRACLKGNRSGLHGPQIVVGRHHGDRRPRRSFRRILQPLPGEKGNHPPKTAGYFGLSSGGGGAPGWGAWRRSRLMQPDRAAGRLASSTEGVRRAGSAASRRSCREHRRARPADRHC